MTAGLMGPQPGAPPMPAAWSLYFATDNIESDVANAMKLGAKVLSPAMAVGRFRAPWLLISPHSLHANSMLSVTSTDSGR